MKLTESQEEYWLLDEPINYRLLAVAYRLNGWRWVTQNKKMVIPDWLEIKSAIDNLKSHVNEEPSNVESGGILVVKDNGKVQVHIDNRLGNSYHELMEIMSEVNHK